MTLARCVACMSVIVLMVGCGTPTKRGPRPVKKKAPPVETAKPADPAPTPAPAAAKAPGPVADEADPAKPIEDEFPVVPNEVKLITSFETGNPFDNGEIVTEHATDGTKAMRLDRIWASYNKPQDWTGFDYVKADVHTDAKKPLKVYFEVRDTETKGYWTRVNYHSIVSPGSSTLVIPTALYVGEKSRPGRPLKLDSITRMVYSIGEKPAASLYIDNVRLERDNEARSVAFEGLHAFDLGKKDSPIMEGFTQIEPGSVYTKDKGFGLKNARVWRPYNVLQPEPLYQDFLCIESGGVAVDVPNGRWHVFVNQDSPSGFWGEYQLYPRRAVVVEGQEHVDTMELESFKKKYFRFWDTEDLPTDNTFDKYQEEYFAEKEFEVEVTDGQLNIEFEGRNWANCVSCIVAYPVAEAKKGQRFMKYMKRRRRFHFDNYFNRVLHEAEGITFKPTAKEQKRGFVLFTRDYMKDVYYNDRPGPGERSRPARSGAFAGEMEPVTFSVYPLKDLGEVRVEVMKLVGPDGAVIRPDAVRVGYVINRLSRVNMDGSVYTIKPRQVIPRNAAPVPMGLTRRFWLTVTVPKDARPGKYVGAIAIYTTGGGSTGLSLELKVHPGELDEVDVPAGPWGHTIGLPWYDGNATQAWRDDMALKSLEKLREYGLTSCSGLPRVGLRRFEDGKPVIDFSVGDAQMARMKAAGFTMPVITYTRFDGLDLYFKDEKAMKRHGFTDYSKFIGAIFSEVQRHADEAGWLPVYWNLGDEPIGDALIRSAENAEAYHEAFPKGPPLFTAASSFKGGNKDDPHFRLAKALHVVDWNGHDEASVNALHDLGGHWAFYNGANRWTYGIYMYKAVKQFDMKFRLSWHWNVVAGDPYYALDCREDDYAWCNSSPTGELIPAVRFERDIREGIDDYRRLLTLARLVDEKKGTAAAREGAKLIKKRMAAFKLDQRDHDALFGPNDWDVFRTEIARAITNLR